MLIGLLCATALAVSNAPVAGAAEPRIVSLAPHLTELAYAAGLDDRLVGAVEWSDHPEAAQALPRIGDAFRIDPERILSLDSSHALAWVGGTPEAAIEQLTELGIEVVRIETRSLEQIAEALDRLSALAGEPETGRHTAAAYREQLDRLRQQRSNRPALRVFYQISPRPLFTLGGRHVINEVFDLCGARNIFAGLDQEAVSVSAEAVLDRAPDVLLVGLEPIDVSEPVSEAHARERLDPNLARFECGAVLGIEAEPLVRPAPRILDAAARLCTQLDALRATATEMCDSADG